MTLVEFRVFVPGQRPDAGLYVVDRLEDESLIHRVLSEDEEVRLLASEPARSP